MCDYLQKCILVVMIVILEPIFSGYSWNTPSPTAPVFDDYVVKKVDAMDGETVLLPCTVHHLGDKVVSWIRSKDLHILTSSRFTFSSDTRFEPVHPELEDFWGLRIRGVEMSDSGQYECQVNTDPKMSLAVYLSVKDRNKAKTIDRGWTSQALIKGPREVHVKDGSQVTFRCDVFPLDFEAMQPEGYRNFLNSEADVRWHHEGDELDEKSERRSRVITNSITGGTRLTSKLHIAKVTWKDSGQYSCSTATGKADSVVLHVVEEEKPEAMQGDYPVSASCSGRLWCSVLVVLLAVANVMIQ